MATADDDLKNFSQFVPHVRENTELRLPELFDLWLLQNPNAEDFVENLVAINDYLCGQAKLSEPAVVNQKK